MKKIIVTGSNKGIGFGIVDYLASKKQWNIIMACRNIELANKARSQILSKYSDAAVSVEQLDVSDSKSIDTFLKNIQQKYQKIDVLVNNAGIKIDQYSVQAVDLTYKTNLYGTIQICEKILPLIQDKGKIITVGSMGGRNAYLQLGKELQDKFRSNQLSKQDLLNLMSQYRNVVKQNTVEQTLQKGWVKEIYRVSKLGINIYMSLFAQRKDVLERQIQAYVCCPGYVSTDMTKHKGPLTVQQGIQTPVYLIQLPFKLNKQLQGQFFQKSALSSVFEGQGYK